MNGPNLEMSDGDFKPASRLSCPACGCTLFTLLRRCRLCGWFVGWGSQNGPSDNARCNCSAASWRDYHLATCPASSDASTSSDLPSSTGTKGDSR